MRKSKLMNSYDMGGVQLCVKHPWEKALARRSCRAGKCAAELLVELPAEQEQTVHLVRCSVADLGFKGCARWREIRERASACGLGLCPALVGPCLRMKYLKQPRGESLHVAMGELTDGEGTPTIFSVDRDVHGRWLRGIAATANTRFHPDEQFVFVD